jgi:hypothetical protein
MTAIIKHIFDLCGFSNGSSGNDIIQLEWMDLAEVITLTFYHVNNLNVVNDDGS